MPDITKQFASFPSEHAYRHPMKQDSRESLAHMLVFPDHGIAGFIYPSIRAGGLGKGRAWLFGPALDAPIKEEVEVQIPEDMNFDDLRMGCLQMAVREPHEVVDLKWNGPRIRFEGHFEALYPVYAFSSHPDGNPPYYGDDRTEQHGRVTAKLGIDGKTLDVEGFLIRDHSWGPRVWGLNQHYKWFHAVTAESSVHFFEMLSFGRRQLRGYLWKDGIMRHIADVEYDFAFDDQMTLETLTAQVTDTDGRRATVNTKTYAKVQLPIDPMVYLNESALTLDIDGAQGTGWCEFCWNRNYFDFAKDYVTQYG